MTPSSHIANEIERLMRDPDALRPEWERMQRAYRGRGYDPNQPRVPAGHSDGGQWTDTGGSAAHPGRIEHPLVHQARIDRLIRPIQRGIEAALALFTALSARNTPDRRAVLVSTRQNFDSVKVGSPAVPKSASSTEIRCELRVHGLERFNSGPIERPSSSGLVEASCRHNNLELPFILFSSNKLRVSTT